MSARGPSVSVAPQPRRFFLDTNILVYTFDETTPLIRAKARELVEMALTTGLGVISYQVVQEFLNVATKKFVAPLSGAVTWAEPAAGGGAGVSTAQPRQQNETASTMCAPVMVDLRGQ